ncbi:hypothetical protein [Rhodanobacter aciditrophus]|uniref:hypothetical protein n=1 Tax=Rhodanobacter aciditrophus TaxID=1623218 RepID=UPI003CF9F5AF
MKTRTALLLALTSITGCSMTHGDPNHPRKNPHPVKLYEVIATAEAPGPWDSVKGYVAYEVSNRRCVPRGSFTGSQNVPNVAFDFKMTRVDEKTWKGYFYGDLLQDEDYFGLGACHWHVTQASPVFSIHGKSFVLSSSMEDVNPYTEYFKKSDFLDQSGKDDGYGTTLNDPEIAKHPDAFFPVTATVKEVTP